MKRHSSEDSLPRRRTVRRSHESPAVPSESTVESEVVLIKEERDSTPADTSVSPVSDGHSAVWIKTETGVVVKAEPLDEDELPSEPPGAPLIDPLHAPQRLSDLVMGDLSSPTPDPDTMQDTLFSKPLCINIFDKSESNSTIPNFKIDNTPLISAALSDKCFKQRKGSAFSCKLCNSTIYTYEKVIAHMNWHTNVAYSCPICGVMFSSNGKLSTHLKNHSKCDLVDLLLLNTMETNKLVVQRSSLQFSCVLCTKEFKSLKLLRDHVKELHMSNFCRACGVCFLEESSLKDHVKFHRGGRVDFFKCSMCSVEFTHRRIFQEHLKIHEIDEISPSVFTKVPKFATGAKLDSCDCPFCMIVPNFSLDKLEGHVLGHTATRCHQCEFYFVDLPSELMCVSCEPQPRVPSNQTGKSAGGSEKLPTATSTGQAIKVCHTCKSKTNNFGTCPKCSKAKKQSLGGIQSNKVNKNKVAPKCSSTKSVTCDYCIEKFDNHTSALRHMVSEHDDYKKYICWCRKKCKDWLEFKRHRARHIDLIDHRCEHCSRKCLGAPSLLSSETDKRLNRCKCCEKCSLHVPAT